MKNLSSKLSPSELSALMKKVEDFLSLKLWSRDYLFQLDSDGDGKLTFDEFRKMFDKINLKNPKRKEKKDPGASSAGRKVVERKK